MSDSFRRAIGRKAVSRASAQNLGKVAHLVVDTGRLAVAAVVIGKGRKAQLVDWDQVTGFGPDAVMVHDEGVLRTAADDKERRAADGLLDLLGRRALSESGTELGTIEDVTFDPETGALEELRIGDKSIPAGSLLGSGSYAAVVAAES